MNSKHLIHVAIIGLFLILATYLDIQAQDPIEMINVPISREAIYREATLAVMECWETSPANLQETPPCYELDSALCVDSDGKSAWNPWTYTRAIVEHPQFPGCPIAITYKTRVCKTNHKIRQQYIMDVALVNNNNVNCTALRAHLNWNGNESDIYGIRDAQFIHDLYALAGKHNFKQFCNNINDYLYCNDYDHIRISYYPGSCRGACRAHFSIGLDWIVISSPRPCEVTACCRVENYFCVDPVTFELVHKEEVTVGDASDCLNTPSDDQQNCLNYYLINYPSLAPFLTDTWASRCNAIECDVPFLNLGGDNMGKK